MIKKELVKINDYLWEIPKSFRSDMRVPARIYASEKMLEGIFRDESLIQLVNSTTLPGIVKYALVMPDCHEGYGLAVGGVVATKLPDGIISPGGVGVDINCGVRLLKSSLTFDDIKDKLVDLTNQIQRDVPSGVGRGGRIKLDEKSMLNVLEKGAKHVVEQGYGNKEDLENCEDDGCMEGADASAVSERAKTRGRDQLGTLGAGNHFLEIQRVDEVFERKFGLKKNQITAMVHCGSRGLGHQVATDYIKLMISAMIKYKIKLPDKELACASFNSSEGQRYFKAMAASANFAWANRQMIVYLIRKSWEKVLGMEALEQIYDVAHNIAKIENNLCVHRKGATRAFPEQAVIVPGSMGTASYLMVGTEKAKESFYSVTHGAGRTMSRHQALRMVRGEQLKKDLENKGIIVKGGSWRGLAEEAPIAYKDIHNVVEVVEKAGLAKRIACLKPMAVIKG